MPDPRGRRICSPPWTSPELPPSSPEGRRASAPPSPAALAARGAIVVVADLNAEKGEALAEEIQGVFARVDVTDTEQIAAAVEAAAEIAPLRACVNSAGIGWAQRTIGRDGELASAHDLGRVPQGRRDQPHRHLRHDPPGGDPDVAQRARRRRPAWRDRQPRLGGGLRRPDRPGVVLGVQGRRGRHDAAGGPRPRGLRHPAQHGGARPGRHPDLRRVPASRRPSRPSSASRCSSPSASATPRSSPAWWWSASPTPT